MGLDLHLVEVSDAGLAYICLGGFVVAFSMISLIVKEKLYMNEVVLGTAFGVLLGPHVADVFNPRSWSSGSSSTSNAVTLEVTRVVLAVGLFAIGVELPGNYMWKNAKSLVVMVVPTMAFGWVVVAAVIYALWPNLNYTSSLAIAACLTPTDPIISAAILSGRWAHRHVDSDIRLLLSAESAANDGLAYPFLSISIYLTVEASTRTAIGKWFLVGCLYQVVLGTILGALLGITFSYIMKISYEHKFIDRQSYVAQYLALAFLTTGIVSTIGSDDLLAAFACGNAVSWDQHFNHQTEDDSFASVIDLMLNCACFVYIGAWLPFPSFNAPELHITPGKLVVLLIVILLLRRIPSMLLLYKWIPEIKTLKKALFSGHFGPMGVGAVFISTLALSHLPVPHDPPQNQQEMLAAVLQPIVSFIVLGSILIHGLSIPFFSVGQEMHISLSRTLTSRSGQTNNPDWLLWARRDGLTLEIGDETQTTAVDVEAGSAPAPAETPASGSSTIRERQHRKQSSSAQVSNISETLMAQEGVLPPSDVTSNITSPSYSSPQLTKAVRFPSGQ